MFLYTDIFGIPAGFVGTMFLLALGNGNQKPDYAWHEGTQFQLFNVEEGREAVCEVPAANGSVIFTLKVKRESNMLTVQGVIITRDSAKLRLVIKL